ncbi:MAG: S9 family peptidase [Candidatus Aminicenantes bacterium]|nr:S9 family peptidase [Candidatus Aminicenantes bacterium]
MFSKKSLNLGLFLLLSCLLAWSGPAGQSEGQKTLTFQDIMKFREIHHPCLSEDGTWLAYELRPDRGDSEARVCRLQDGKNISIARGSRPVFSKDNGWLAAVIRPKAVDMFKPAKKRPKQGMVLLNLKIEGLISVENVKEFAFSEDSRWAAYLLFETEKEPEKKNEAKEEEKAAEKAPQKTGRSGTELVLRNLESSSENRFKGVLSFAFDPGSEFLALSVAHSDGVENGLYLVSLNDEASARPLAAQKNGLYSNLTWDEGGTKLAFLVGNDPKITGDPLKAGLWIWEKGSEKPMTAVPPGNVIEGWVIPEKNNLTWTKDGQRLFFGFKPEEFLEISPAEKKEKEEEVKEQDLFDPDKILGERGVDVWHWNDPYIIPHQKEMWPRIKDKTFLSVYHYSERRLVRLADKELPDIYPTETRDYVLGISDVPYRKLATWEGRLFDLFRVSLHDGSRTKIASRLSENIRRGLSPSGRYTVFYQDKNWHLFDGNTGRITNLTKNIDVPFFDEDHDYPSPVPDYGLAGWVEDDGAVLLYDKYDIWRFEPVPVKAVNLTKGEGRRRGVTFRVVRLDPEEPFFKPGQKLLFSFYHNREKHWGFYEGNVKEPGAVKLVEEKKKFTYLGKAKKADVLIYTRESFEEFPDIWISGLNFSEPKKVSDANPQISDFAWGNPELVEWSSLDGIPLQGILIKPAGYQPGQRCPVIVYFYRFFSQRMYEFNQMVVNHRPNFPFYTSNGYALFLPDIRFEVGHPGFSSMKCLVPGVQKIIDMGVADPDAIGLHGHSWSGYQTAYIITQTDLFACAIAGAPVSNMTSAYSGIRWSSGLARQFQYEQSQSRIGGSLWDVPELYIENSPVFFADRIETPLLIMFGDEDGAVPWYQGIELYLAMRRLEKDCVFLQYRGEPHHPQKYANKLDYSIKMKEYFDHYLKGKKAPDWIKKGISYKGK